MDEIEIRANGLLLRPWRAGDAAEVLRACQDPEILRWTSLPDPYRPEHAETFVTEHTRRAWTDGSSAPLGIFDPGTGELLGSHGLVSLGRGTGEIGYWIAPWARRRRVATRATHAVATWCLHTLGVRRIDWRAEIGNYASRLVAERLGFQLEGVLRSSGRRASGPPVDCWVASLLPGELAEPDALAPPRVERQLATFASGPPRLVVHSPGGEEITLRPLVEADLDAIVAACQDPYSQRWTTVPSPYRPQDAQFFVDHHAPLLWARGDGAVFAIAGPDGGYAGSAELRLVAPGVGDVGYLVAPWARGRGYASTALAELCRWGFAALGLHRIEWRAYVGNDISRRTALRAGFQLEGLARAGCGQRGEHRDAWTGAILATDPSSEGRTHG